MILDIANPRTDIKKIYFDFKNHISYMFYDKNWFLYGHLAAWLRATVEDHYEIICLLKIWFKLGLIGTRNEFTTINEILDEHIFFLK
jgi:hypothetical protein